MATVSELLAPLERAGQADLAEQVRSAHVALWPLSLGDVDGHYGYGVEVGADLLVELLLGHQVPELQEWASSSGMRLAIEVLAFLDRDADVEPFLVERLRGGPSAWTTTAVRDPRVGADEVEVIEAARAARVPSPRFLGERTPQDPLVPMLPTAAMRHRGVTFVPGTLLMQDRHGGLLHDVAEHPLIGDIELADGVVRVLSTGQAVVPRLGVDAEIPAGVVVTGLYDTNYWHLVTEWLPRLLALQRSELVGDRPILMNEGLRRVPQFEELVAACIDLDRVRWLPPGRNYRVDDAVVLTVPCAVAPSWRPFRSLPTHGFGMSIDTLSDVSARLRDRIPTVDPPTTARRLFLSRAGQAAPKLRNESELWPVLERRGFDRFAPERHSVAEQAAVFAEAEAVVGATGAGFTNLLFSERRPSALLFQADSAPHQFGAPWFSGPGAAVGATVRYLAGEPLWPAPHPWHAQFDIEPAALDAALDELGLE